MKEADKKEPSQVSGGYFGPLETDSPIPGPMPTVPPFPTDTTGGDNTTTPY